ncbi:hypothetical protein [Stenotrophomonas phage RAS14]
MKMVIANSAIWTSCISRSYAVEPNILDCITKIIRYYDPNYKVYKAPTSTTGFIARKLHANEKRNRPQVEKVRIHYMDMANE